MQVRIANTITGKYDVGIYRVKIIDGEIEIITYHFNNDEVDKIFEDFSWVLVNMPSLCFYDYEKLQFMIPTKCIVSIKKTLFNGFKIIISNDFINKNALLK